MTAAIHDSVTDARKGREVSMPASAEPLRSSTHIADGRAEVWVQHACLR